MSKTLKEMSPSELKAHFDEQGIVIGDCITAFGVDNTNAYVMAARDVYASDDLEIDDTTTVVMSDEGAWVLVWQYVSNDEAGLVEPPHSETLTKLVDALKPRDVLFAPKLRAKIDWLESTLLHFADEIDAIDDHPLVPGAAPTTTSWTVEEGVEQFLPSAALFDLILAARMMGLSTEDAEAAEAFVTDHGDMLDCVHDTLKVANVDA